MRSTALSFALAVLVDATTLATAATINVPADQPTIQAGIDAAVDGDTVLVADGVYTGDGNRDIDFEGKAIFVMSENGPAQCIINCEGTWSEYHRGFYFRGGESSSAIVQGFTITNGFEVKGGAIHCRNSSSPTIRGNLIISNSAAAAFPGYGGGIYCNSSSPLIVDNTIVWNTANFGGGIVCEGNCAATITGNTVSQNSANFDGGGIEVLTNCSGTVENNLVTSNMAGAYTGGIGCAYNSHPIINGNLIAGNQAYDIGGLGVAYDSHPVVVGNTVTGNVAENTAGGIGVGVSSYPTLDRNTITGNTASTRAGGIQLVVDAQPVITNTIVWGNEAPLGNEIWVGSEWGADSIPSHLTINYSDVEGGMASVDVDQASTVDWGEGMIDDDPLFVLPDKQDHRLLWESPCIDAGHPDSIDVDGTPFDMGAHCFNQDDHLTLYVTPDEKWLVPGDQLGVTYTAINRWEQDEPLWLLTQVLLPSGDVFDLLGPDRYTLPSETTVQVHVSHDIPLATPVGNYEYWSRVGLPPATLYDEDSFAFFVVD